MTLCRALVAVPCALCIGQQRWWLAASLFTVAVLSDYFDGRVARAAGQSSAAGGVIDHATDAGFVGLCLAAAAYNQQLSAWLPPLIWLAFLQYALDSAVLHGKPLRANWLGRYNGIAYFVLTGFAIGLPLLQRYIGLPALVNSGLYTASVLLALSTGVSMLIRASYWLRYRS